MKKVKTFCHEPGTSYKHRFSAFMLPIFIFLLIFSGCAPKKTAPVDPSLNVCTNATEVSETDLPDSGAEVLEPEVDPSPSDVKEQSENLTPQEHKVLLSDSGIEFNLNEHDTKEVQQYFTFFTHKARKTFARWLDRAENFLPYVREQLSENGLPQDVAMLPFAESGYNAWAYSRVGAAGMWQFMPYTGRKYGLRVDWWVDERRDPYESTKAAIKYLTDLHEMFGDWYLAFAAYNAGEGKISRALKKTGCENFFELTRMNHKLSYRHRLRKETKNYVPKFIAISKIFKNLTELDFQKIDWDAAPKMVHLKVPGGTDLLALANACGLKWKEFLKYNPHFRRQVSPPDSKSNVHLPVALQADASEYISSPGSRPFAGYSRYKIRRGDSWYRIARRSGIPVRVLKSVNNTRSNLLRPGHYVMIPGRGSKRTFASRTTTRRYAQKRANYRVRRGDTLWSISRGYQVSVNTLKRANGLRSSSLKIGQKLYIPDSSASETKLTRSQAAEAKTQVVNYRVRRGDNLWAIARRFGVKVSALMKWNSLSSKSILRPGDKIKVYVR
ncbi:LysM peptidoglycan-binding domain-containing protein [Maridesulfovibrio bastinii]|jgi:membrane-bound lytic murein transglycosylase D|uniref:LysM peptidoglycan-binding domain-containing protein n=1 Tax=Maridesulfovibrio bastinii TaxID=47157 RepID=UPI000412C13D|nr:LysM peptidoglycan-binding domain-containing protein [Maridesulfovibrio bastinii]